MKRKAQTERRLNEQNPSHTVRYQMPSTVPVSVTVWGELAKEPTMQTNTIRYR